MRKNNTYEKRQQEKENCHFSPSPKKMPTFSSILQKSVLDLNYFSFLFLRIRSGLHYWANLELNYTIFFRIKIQSKNADYFFDL